MVNFIDCFNMLKVIYDVSCYDGLNEWFFNKNNYVLFVVWWRYMKIKFYNIVVLMLNIN